MKSLILRPLRPVTSVVGGLLFAFACSSGSSNNGGTGGAASGGAATGGGSATGGSATGGSSTGGNAHTGGQMSTGGQGATGGQIGTGGQGTTGGQGATAGQGVTGGTGQGGKNSTGGQGVGGNATGGAGTGGAGGGSASCADGSLLFCEDFESAASGAATSTSKWMTEVSTGSTAGTLTIDNMHARGQKALHVHTVGNGRGLIHVKNFAPPNNSFYGRMWLWVDAFPSAPNYAHFTMVEAVGTGNSSKVRPIGGQFIDGQLANSTNVFWGPGSDAGPTGDWTNWKPSAPAKAASWVCIQWQMDASKNGISISIDNKPNADLTVSTKSHTGSGDFVFPMFNDIWFGWWLYQSGPTPDHFDIWLDDLALGTSPIPCG